MTAILYLAALLVSTVCMGLLDHRFRLVLWHTPRGRAWRGAVTVLIGVVFFLIWDLAAIAFGHYGAGRTTAMTGIMVAPELPIEEIVFITFLSYLTLVLRGLIIRGAQWIRRTPSHEADREVGQ
ncbi:MAG: lycopene cyclase domain-containing protein [Brevibacterium yomogidense]|uniref:lycopene cyclase domain-containing protein n=1 Tax=Brevibacterium sp. Mu109 TaxID=1255669 RepID=UPI000C35A3F7|nr:lycopene cyclase domain-containing protein [Brevibacterium sp. Mu109]SMX90727.1 lycopene cyclase domain-containing protein [Brevibacterium sp. Mu109]